MPETKEVCEAHCESEHASDELHKICVKDNLEIDIHVEGDPRGWEVPDEERIYQFLKIYQASSKDSYRNENNNDKDFVKIEYLSR